MPVNLDPYRLDADYKHRLRSTPLLTAWVADSVGAVGGFLEFRGHDLIHFFRGVTRNGRVFLKGGPPLPGPLPHFMAEGGKTAEAIELRQPGVVWPYSLSGRDEALKKKRGTK